MKPSRRTAFGKREYERLVLGKPMSLREQIGELAPALPVGAGRVLDALLDRIESIEEERAARLGGPNAE